jgi:FAD-linked oxidoreductase
VRWANWGRTVRLDAVDVLRPRDPDAVVGELDRARRDGVVVRAVGAGHSFTSLAAGERLLSLDAWQGVESVDWATGVATVRAGTRLRRLGEELRALGLAQENLGDIDAQSIAGAVATGTHGTGLGLGALHTQLAWIELVAPDGSLHRFEAGSEAFRAAQVSLGALGVVVRVGLRAQPAYRLAYEHGPGRLEDVLGDLAGFARSHRHAELYWFPHTDRVLLKRQDRTDEPADPSSLPRRLNEAVLENGAYVLLSEVAALAPRVAPAISRLSAAAVATTRGVDESRRVFATTRWVRFVEAEHGLPLEAGAAALRDLRAWLAARRFPVHMPLEVRFVAGDDAMLSMAHGRDSVFVAVHAYRGMPHREWFAAAERILLRHGGRPHWGKLHALSAATLRPRYPRFDDFLEVRAELDPGGVLLNDHLRRVLGVPSG